MNQLDKIISELSELKAKINVEFRSLLLQNKTVLSFDEACEYCGLSKSYMYKITSQLPFSKPNGKTLFIAKEDLDTWLLSNKTKSETQRSEAAATYIATH